jgi:hypothetical protein
LWHGFSAGDRVVMWSIFVPCTSNWKKNPWTSRVMPCLQLVMKDKISCSKLKTQKPNILILRHWANPCLQWKAQFNFRRIVKIEMLKHTTPHKVMWWVSLPVNGLTYEIWLLTGTFHASY